MVIKVLDHTKFCYTNDDGERILNLVKPYMDKGEKITVSFEGVDSITSSFVNSAFIELLGAYPFEYIRSNLTFLNTTKNINTIIKNRFKFEVEKRLRG